jgi:1,4-dihydroxy-6-naphthoate synthase
VTHLRIAFSPDSDDLFMFWPLLRGKVAATGLTFEPMRADTETLNREAVAGDLDVVAISVASYPLVRDRYFMLPHGGSVGRGYGPMLIANDPCEVAALGGKRIAVPGLGTTGYLVLRLLLPSFAPVFVPITPPARVFQALRSGDVDAALIIHEGRLTFEQEGFVGVLDIGRGWSDLTGGLPLPLGCNVIKKGLGPELVAEVSGLLRESIRWALSHREALIDELLFAEARADLDRARRHLDRYLSMYANDDSLAYSADVKLAIDTLFAKARAAHLTPGVENVEWAP